MLATGCLRIAGRLGWTLIAPLVLVTGCDRAPGASAPSAAASDANTVEPAAAPAPPKPAYTLIMTWMYGNQPPQTTQTVFHDQVACDQARDAAIAEGRRLALETLGDAPAATAHPAPPAPPKRYIGQALLPSDSASPPAAESAPQSTPPKVAAICAAT